MCEGSQRSLSPDHRRSSNANAVVVEDLLRRLAENEARLQQARSREAELSRKLEEMKRFLSVIEILESYLKRRFHEQRETVMRLFSSVPRRKGGWIEHYTPQRCFHLQS
ncbi:hypothetical protein SLEP1_g47156 [Rubroshorea leprosula]|uniref:Protein SKIP34 n=2 Tax=Rubroshorea leprosula TaxID=152421 RepID=A0AAV5LQC7_9ROSI|nr:hypothetical protein SLEP1_g47156 [Rubroshorea leprosula]